MRLVLLAALGFGLAACATECPTGPQAGNTTVHYTCEDGSDLTATFSRNPDLAQVVQEGYAPLSLPGRITGAGYRYADAGAELKGRGVEARWTRPGAAETICHEGQQPSN